MYEESMWEEFYGVFNFRKNMAFGGKIQNKTTSYSYKACYVDIKHVYSW